MTVEQALKFLEEQVAPVKMSDDFCTAYKMYDNSGVIINCANEVKGILFSLDLSEAAVKKAQECGCNLIVTHHPAIYGGISRFDLNSSAQARALAACLKGGISVISMHLNFDAAPCGIDYYLMSGLGGKTYKALSTVDGGAYGRAYSVPPVAMEEFVKRVCSEFSTGRYILYGKTNRMVEKVASFCGAGLDDAAVEFCKSNKVDVAVSSDLAHHRISELVESGVTVLQLTHYCAESYGLEKIYEDINKKLPVPSTFFKDGRFV